MFYWLFMQDNLFSFFSPAFYERNCSIKILITVRVQRNHPTRGILHLLSGKLLLCVEFCIFWGMDGSCAWESAIPERWTVSARGILHFVRGGLLLRVGFRDS